MNNVSLVGRLTRDVVTKYSQDGKAVSSGTLAVDRRFSKDNSADFISIKAFGKTAEFLEKYGKKGVKFGVVGHIQTGSYQNKDGKTVYTTDVIVDNCEFTESKANSNGSDTETGFVNIPDGIDEELPFN